MEPGDLILTPKLTWHDHSNDSKQPMIWLDGLDFPLITALHQVMQERYPERRQPIEKSSEENMSQLGRSIRHGLPLADFFHYKWRDTRARAAGIGTGSVEKESLRRLSARISQSTDRRADDDDDRMRRTASPAR